MATWVRSNRCESSACVEAAWSVSSHCASNACVEVGHSEGEVLMRDSKDPEGPVLRFTLAQWHEFIRSIKD